MDLQETGDVTTPVDDPCQFNPAWRSLIAGYLFQSGVRSDDDFESVNKFGGVTVSATDEADSPEDQRKSGKKKVGKAGKSGKKDIKKKAVKKKIRPIPPFDTNPEYRQYASDRWIRLMVGMMDARSRGHLMEQEHVPFRLADMWYREPDSESAMKKRIEPLLLTEATIETITLDLIGVPSAQPAIEAYEKLYFNCRDDNFALSSSGQLVQKFAMPWGPLRTFLRKWEDLDEDGFCIQDGRPIAKDSDIWRAIAATMGYDALIYAWKWNRRAHGMKSDSLESMIELSWKVAVMQLMSDMFTGNIKHEDAARILAAYTAQAKKISEDRNEGGDGDDTTMALLAIMAAAAPKMRALVDGGEGMITDNDIQSRIESQLAIDKTKIQDAGKQVETEIIDAQIAEAVER